ncbi:phytochelatin synthase family protein [Leptolyngbya sp. AN03gr2]|uniref:phytochelatin synthase family protein n=1 Tax=unclassified Leptolyngbya TaxID=2650499 RepID=UPI003D31F46C
MNQTAKLARTFRKIVVRSAIAITVIFGTSFVGISAYVFSPPSVHRLSLPSNLIGLDSPLGQQLLAESRTKQDYAILAQQFQTQKLRAYCGVASAVTVLNALKPSVPPFNQDTFFTPQAEKIRSSYAVAFMGMSLEQLAALLKSHEVRVETHHASDTTLEQFRTQVKANLARDRDFVVVNYERAGIGQTKGGHISPISAYHEKSDRFLIKDVSSYKYPLVWVSASDLWKAMNTHDFSTNRTRGYLLIHQ